MIMNEKNAQSLPWYPLKLIACLGALGLTATIFFPATVCGLGFSIPNQDAEAIARGNAFIATANNPSAIFYNPAGITQLEGTQVQFGAHNLAVNAEFESLDGTRHAETKSDIASVPQFYFTYSPKNSQFSFGAGLYAPFGLALEWPTNTPFRTLAEEGRLTYITFNPVAAWKILPNLSIAAGPTINYSKIKLRQGIGFSPGDEFGFDGSGWDFGATAGLLWKPHEKWSVGVNYRSPNTINFKGSSQMKPYAPGESTSAELNFPQSAGLGVAYMPTPQWNFEAYVTWTDWDTLKETTFKKPSGNIPFALNWQSSLMTGIGGTRYFDTGWFVSAGYFFSQNSTSEKNFNPILPDTDLHVGSAGFGYKGQHWRFALAAQIITGAWRTVSGSQSPSLVGETADGKYKWFNQSVNFSVGYHF
jgi:long-chain fatty acid transport protein